MHQDHFVSSDHIWMNAASEGPLLKCAHEALEEAVALKSEPQLLKDQFARVPVELKTSLGQLMGVASCDIILGNSVSYGICILANSFRWEQGDEVLLMEDDFPSNILPWLALEKQGVVIRQLKPQGQVLTPDEIQSAITERTKWICLSHIHTFTGWPLDVASIAKIARRAGAHCAVNIAQSLGNRPVNVSKWDVDAVVGVGYKWLCGPYGTGFAWIHPGVRKDLDDNHPYWPAYLNKAQLQESGPLTYKRLTSARTFDVFGTANFFNFVPLKAAVDFWLKEGIEKVSTYIDGLVDQFIRGLDQSQYDLISPEDSHLIVISQKDQRSNKGLYEKLVSEGIHPAYWKHNLRFSPHTYNTSAQIDKIISFINISN